MMATGPVRWVLLAAALWGVAARADDEDEYGRTEYGRADDDDDAGYGEVQDMDKFARIAALQLEAEGALRDAEPFMQRVAMLRERQRRVDDGWVFQGSAAKAMNQEIAVAEQEHREAMRQVDIIRAQIKPLYGVVSQEHLAEHRETIYNSFQVAKDTANNHLWWQTLFGRGGRDDSLEALLLRMAMTWLTGLTFGYVIGFVKFVFSAPFVIYEYTSSITDVPAAIGMYAFTVALFLLPLIALYYAMVAASGMRRAAGAGGGRRRPFNVADGAAFQQQQRIRQY